MLCSLYFLVVVGVVVVVGLANKIVCGIRYENCGYIIGRRARARALHTCNHVQPLIVYAFSSISNHID